MIGASIAAKRYYETASLPRTATLSLERGIVLFRDAVSSTLVNAHDNLLLREGDDLLVGQGARASVALADYGRVLLYPGSELRLSEFRKSRFHDGFTLVALRLAKGTARLEVGTPRTETTRFLVTTPHGSTLLSEGSYGLEVSNSQTRVAAREGSATAYSGDKVVEVKAGEKVLLGRDGVTGPLAEGDQLLLNGDFSQGFARWEMLQVDEPGRPLEPGQRMLIAENVGGRAGVALRLARNSVQASHNETGLTQVINKDVSDYESLTLRADVRVAEQSLSGGGYLGYEYPIMIRVRYRDATDGQIDWSHGFFYKNPEDRPTPNGQEVPQGQWISYLGDLMTVSPRPAYVISMEVLGAGHTFDGMVANVSLVGR